MRPQTRRVLDSIGPFVVIVLCATQGCEPAPAAPPSHEGLLKSDPALSRGDAAQAAGDLDGALAAYREGLQRTTRSAAPQERAWAGLLQDRIGTLLEQMGDLDGAIRAHRRSVELAEEQTRGAPGDLEWQLELGTAHNNLAIALDRGGDLDGALASVRRAIAVTAAIVLAEPHQTKWLECLTISYSTLAEILANDGEQDADAVIAYRRRLELAEDRAGLPPPNPAWSREVVAARTDLGALLRRTEDLNAAVRVLEPAVGLADEHVTADPESVEARRARWEGGDELGAALRDLTRFDEALRVLERNLELLTEAPAGASEELGPELASAHYDLGDVLYEREDFAAAARHFRTHVNLLEASPDADSDERQTQISVGWSSLGVALEADGDAPGAIAAFRHVVEGSVDPDEERRDYAARAIERLESGAP